ncbi:MAG: efflux RND transporter permease subunit [Proteobacteria bacterium]|nr:efflux RND transporter permease subunit [Pseudomonadota bacterium]
MHAIVRTALQQRVLVLVFFLGFLGVGVMLFQRLNIEAYPDPTPPLVDVVTQVQGLSAEEIERYITIPIEVQMAGMPNLKVIRTISLFGLSDVKLQFSFDYTYEEALQQVLNRLSQLPQLPGGAQPSISPTSPIGEIYRYKLVGPKGYSTMDLRTLQDWVLQRRFRAIPGVIDVSGWGGRSKVYEVEVDFAKLLTYKLTLSQVLTALTNANLNVGGNTVNIGPQSAVVRGVGQIRSIDDIGGTMISQANGSPVLVRDIAKISIGQKPRLGIAGFNDDDDSVMGIVLMRRGQESTPTIERVHKEVAEINASNLLPPGVRIERYYDRKDLIDITTHTVLHNMIVGIGLIFILQWLFLGNIRSALIVAATIPFALFFAVALLVLRRESANLLSVGAIDFGLVVDATVIMVESIYRGLAGHGEEHEVLGIEPRARDKLRGILVSASSVSRSIFFSAAIIIVGFLPLFTLSGVEGHIFGPMAKTYAYAIAGGLLATFTVSPALSALLLPSKVEEKDTLLVRTLHSLYAPVLRGAVAARIVTLTAAAAIIVLAAILVRSLGLEFLPKLEEGNIWLRATLPPTISLEEGSGYVNRMRRVILGFPEVEIVVSQHGRPDDGTDAAGFFNAEFFVPLKPEAVAHKEDLTTRMLDALQKDFPGVEFNFSQYLQDNVSEAVSGVKGENSIKLFGNDLAELTRTGAKIKSILSSVKGVEDLAVFSALGQPTVQIDIDRAKAARYGLAPGDINAAIKTAVGGDQAGDLYEDGSDRHFPIIVRLAPQYRRTPETIRNLTIGAQGANGIQQIPLSEVANVKLTSGASYIYREQQQRYLPIKFSVRDRDLGSTIAEAQEKIAKELPEVVPNLKWVGEFDNLQQAIERLSIVVPVSIVLIGLLLYMNFGSLRDTLLALSVIPMATVGGIVGLFLMQIPFSISAAIGFIALFGISVMDGIIVLDDFNRRVVSGIARRRAIIQTCETQMRPVVMTCIIACVGLLPAAVSTGIGSQVQKPLAVVVVGGMLFAPLLILIVLPVLVLTFSNRKPLVAALRAEERQVEEERD